MRLTDKELDAFITSNMKLIQNSVKLVNEQGNLVYLYLEKNNLILSFQKFLFEKGIIKKEEKDPIFIFKKEIKTDDIHYKFGSYFNVYGNIVSINKEAIKSFLLNLEEEFLGN